MLTIHKKSFPPFSQYINRYTIDTSKESNFDAYSKYVKFIKSNLIHQKLQAWGNLPNFWKKGGNTLKNSSDLNKNHSIRISIPKNLDVEVSSSHVQKCEILLFLARRKIKDKDKMPSFYWFFYSHFQVYFEFLNFTP
jgi:hypothetical protein